MSSIRPGCVCADTSLPSQNVLADPDERREMSREQPAIKAQLVAALEEAMRTVYTPPIVPNDPACCAAAGEKYGGFLGPFIQ